MLACERNNGKVKTVLVFILMSTIYMCSACSTAPAGENEPLFRIGKYKTGFINSSGKVVIKPQFTSAGEFSEGLAIIFIREGDETSYGYISKKGRFVIEPRPLSKETDVKGYGEFHDGLASIPVKDKYGYIDTSGIFVIAPELDLPEYGDLKSRDYSEGFTVIEVDGKYGYMDTSGKIAIEPQFDFACPFSEGLARIRNDDEENGGWRFTDSTGQIVISHIEAKHVSGFHDGLACLETDNGFGYIDKEGAMAIEPGLVVAEDFSEGLALVWIEEDDTPRCAFIDTTGELVIKPGDIANCRSFHDSRAAAKIGPELTGGWGFVDKTGEFVIEPQYSEVEDFHNGLAIVWEIGDRGNSMSYINPDGKKVWQSD